MNVENAIDDIEIFEWYDGLVLGIVQFNKLQALVCLLAFDPDAKRRLYLLATVPSKVADNLHKSFKETGPQAFTELEISTALEKNQDFYLTQSEPTVGKPLKLTPLTTNQRKQLPPLSFPIIEHAVTRNKTWEWFS